ncbi:MAG: glycerol-3-phosphate acyltransferase [Chloroflexi bacterium]|nr:glycerol-3-phosphate acyltransferase [Chloroflexota bacterium]
MWLAIIGGFLIGYLFGAIPVGYLVGKAYGVDVRKVGSGRIGGTNVWRAAGVTAAALTVVGDAAKAILGVLLANVLFPGDWAMAMAGAGVVFGHNWPLWLGFKGGAGGVVGGLTLMVINPLAAEVVIPLAIANLYFTRYASIGTLNVGLGSIAVLVAMWLLAPEKTPFAHVVYAFLLAIAIIWALRPNLKRLQRGEERRITLW